MYPRRAKTFLVITGSGGGVDEGEGLSQALGRELMEEVGARGAVTEELGKVVEFRDYKKMKRLHARLLISVLLDLLLMRTTKLKI